MTDYADLEAAMYADQEQAERAERARARVDAHGPHLASARPDPEQHRNAMRTYQLHDNRPALHAWLKELEDQCIDLLPSEDQARFR